MIPEGWGWAVLTLIFVIYTIANANRANIGVAMPFIRKEFPINNTEVGAKSAKK